MLNHKAAITALERYQAQFETAYMARFRAKLGLTTAEEKDDDLLSTLLGQMQASRADWTIFWRRLCDFDSQPEALNAPLRDLFQDRAGFDAWAAEYRLRLRHEASQDSERQARMRRANPKYILRNHLAEQAIRDASAGDFSQIETLRHLLARPYDEQPEFETYADLPPDWANELSVSCSS